MKYFSIIILNCNIKVCNLLHLLITIKGHKIIVLHTQIAEKSMKANSACWSNFAYYS